MQKLSALVKYLVHTTVCVYIIKLVIYGIGRRFNIWPSHFEFSCNDSGQVVHTHVPPSSSSTSQKTVMLCGWKSEK